MRLFLVKLTEALQRLNRGLIGMIHAYRYIIVLDRSSWVSFSFAKITEPIVRFCAVGGTRQGSLEISARLEASISFPGEIS
jgi:hypothetical protein